MDVTVSWEFDATGEVGLSATGKLAFPPVPGAPGVYRIRALLPEGTETYVGESSHLYRRFEHDYKYMPRGQTNIWVREWLTNHLADGSKVELSWALSATASDEQQQITLDFERKTDRVLVEAAALVTARAAGEHVRNKAEGLD